MAIKEICYNLRDFQILLSLFIIFSIVSAIFSSVEICITSQVNFAVITSNKPQPNLLSNLTLNIFAILCSIWSTAKGNGWLESRHVTLTSTDTRISLFNSDHRSQCTLWIPYFNTSTPYPILKTFLKLTYADLKIPCRRIHWTRESRRTIY
jgi:hypothetical protein